MRTEKQRFEQERFRLENRLKHLEDKQQQKHGQHQHHINATPSGPVKVGREMGSRSGE